MPRQPDTLASVWLYLCASDMISAKVDNGGVERPGSDQHTAQREEKGLSHYRLYWFARSSGVDGQSRWTVHEDQQQQQQQHNDKEPEVMVTML